MTATSIRTRAPKASSAGVRRMMQAVRVRDTTSEVLLRSELHRVGLRFRKNYRPAIGLPRVDVAFPGRRLLLFVDGCFWHGCPIHFRLPKSNASWWREKIDATAERDARQGALLEGLGWSVIRVWEHELRAEACEETVARIAHCVRFTGARD
jgi:DNA mismatch endonuclease, patch repair protein